MATQNSTKFICEKCEKTFIRKGNLLNHKVNCKGNKVITIDEKWLNIESGKYSCPYCEKEFNKSGVGTHIWRMHGNGQNWDACNSGYKDGSRESWNKGLTIETDERVSKARETLKEGYESGRLVSNQLGKKLSNETKSKISKSRIKFLKENPDKVPYLLNHKSKGESYPERYFREILEKENIKFIQEKQESLYSIDFAINMIDLEIDGEQHYVDKRIVESDKRRTKYLEELGYVTIRIRWSQYQKLNKSEKEQFVVKLVKRLK